MVAVVKRCITFCMLVLLGLVLTYYRICASDAYTTKTENQVNFESLSEVQRIHTINSNKPAQTRGFVLAGDYWEQFSSASRNLQNLQCWAGQHGVKVLEPYSANSMLYSLLSPLGGRLRFSDLVDLEHWNRESVRMGHSEVVPWESFYKEASRDVITVHLKFTTKKTRSLPAEVKKNPNKFPPREIRYKEGCLKIPTHEKLSKSFRIVRKVCLNLEYGDILTMSEFNTLIYGPFNPNRTIVYFSEWKGLSGIGRITVTQPSCFNTGLQEHMLPSPRLMTHVNQYISSYLQDSEFLAVIARIEKAKKKLGNQEGSIKYCLTKTLENWEQIKTKSKLSKTFLSIDMGKYGSRSFKQNASVLQDFDKFFHGVYGDKWSIKEWETSFENTGNTLDIGYVAMLQKLIATRAKCILLIGGGSFQKHALALYQARVPEADWCIQSVPECTKKEHLMLTQLDQTFPS